LSSLQVHLLCLVAHGIWRSRLCNHELLQALMLSHIPVQYMGRPAGKWSLNTLTLYCNWFATKFKIVWDQDNNTKQGMCYYDNVPYRALFLFYTFKKCVLRYAACHFF
jgi:hypothetical protein